MVHILVSSVRVNSRAAHQDTLSLNEAEGRLPAHCLTSLTLHKLRKYLIRLQGLQSGRESIAWINLLERMQPLPRAGLDNFICNPGNGRKIRGLGVHVRGVVRECILAIVDYQIQRILRRMPVALDFLRNNL